MSLKKPSELFQKEKSFISEDYNPVVKEFNETFDKFRGNITLIEELRNKVNTLSEELDNKIAKSDLDNAMFSHLLMMNENIKTIQSEVKGLNRNDLFEFKTTASHLEELVEDLSENQFPKCKKRIVDTELRISEKFDHFKSEINSQEKNLNEKLDNFANTVDGNFSIFNETIEETKQYVTETVNTYKKLYNVLESKTQKENKTLEEYSQVLKEFNEEFLVFQTHIQDQIGEYEKINSVLDEKLFSYESNFNSFKSDISETIESNIDNIRKENTNKILEVNTNISKVNTNISEVKNNVSSLKADIVVYEKHKNSLNSQVNFIQEDLSSFKKSVPDFKSLKSTQNKISEELNQTKKNVKDIQEKTEKNQFVLDEKFLDLNSWKNDINHNLSEFEANNTSLFSKVNFIEENVIQIKDDLVILNTLEEQQNKIFEDFQLLEKQVYEYDYDQLSHKVNNFEIDFVDLRKNLLIINDLNSDQNKLFEDLKEVENYIEDHDHEVGQLRKDVYDEIEENLKIFNKVKTDQNKLSEDLKKVEDYIEDHDHEVGQLRKDVYDEIEENLKIFNKVKTDQNKLSEDLKKVENYISENHKEIKSLKEQVFSEIQNLPFGDIQENIQRLENKIGRIHEAYSQIKPETMVHDVLQEAKTLDPLTPLNKTFVTLDQLQEHYRLFINRIQQQLSSLGGGGETQLKYLDDIVGIATNASAYDGMFLKYNHDLKKFEFDTVISGGQSYWTAGTVGIHTLSDVGIGTTNPQYKLDVSGDINFSGSFYQNGSLFVASRWTSGSGDNIYRLNGNVGIGTTNPTTKLDVDGTIKATDFDSLSDINLKKNIQSIENPIEKIMSLNGVSFEWKENHKKSMGVIAQDIEKILPDLVSGEEIKTVNYNGIIAVLIEVVKNQQKQIDELKTLLS